MTPRPYSLDSAVRRDESLYAGGEFSPTAQSSAEIPTCCAYNQTRECFLGTEVEVAVLPSADARLPMRAGDFGAGMWLVPFKGISPLSVRVPVDLIYLSKDYTVVDAVESFPLFRGSAFGPFAASVLVLPPNTIRSTETQSGDRLLLCSADEMQRRLRPAYPSVEREPEQTAALFEQAPPLSGTGRLLHWEDRSGPKSLTEAVPPVAPVPLHPSSDPLSSSLEMQETDITAALPVEAGAIDPAGQKDKPARNWLQRLFAFDPPNRRSSPRESLRGLVAYFFTGGTPEAQYVRDISQSGVYVCTAERWYLGTVVRMTLTDRFEPTVDRSITMNMAVVRCGEDGVGLKFLLQSRKDRRKGQLLGVDEADVHQFLHRFKQAVV